MDPLPPIKIKRVTTLMDYMLPTRGIVTAHTLAAKAIARFVAPSKPKQPAKPKE